MESTNIKTTTTKLTYRIEEKPGGGFISRCDDSSAETFEGATREEVQQKIDDKLLAMLGDFLHHRVKIGDVAAKLDFTEKVTTTVSTSKPSQTVPENAALATSEPRFESTGSLWRWIALLIAIGAILLYLLRR